MQQSFWFEEDSEPLHETATFHEAKQYLENRGKILVFSGIRRSRQTKTISQLHLIYTEYLSDSEENSMPQTHFEKIE